MNLRPVSSVAGRIGGFSLSVGAATIVGILAMPLLVLALGPGEWGILVLVQTVGQLAGIFVAFGWGATGAAMVAGAVPAARLGLYRESLRVRLILYACVAPATALVLLALTRGDVMVSVLGALVYLLPHLGGTWFFTGQARPLRLFLCDTLPTMCGTVLGVIGAILTGELWAFLAGQGLGFLVAVITDAVVILRGAAPATGTRPRMRDTLSDQRHAVVATATSGLYVSLPIVAVQAFIPAQLPVYAMADRLFRYASIVFLPIQQFFQGWVPDPEADLARRARAAAGAGAAIGLIAGILIALLSPFASTLLSAGQLTVPLELSIPLGVAFVGVGTSAVVGYACLVAVGHVRALAASTVIGALVGAPLIIGFAMLGSLPLVAWSVAVSELSVAGYQVLTLRRALRERDVRQ